MQLSDGYIKARLELLAQLDQLHKIDTWVEGQAAFCKECGINALNKNGKCNSRIILDGNR